MPRIDEIPAIRSNVFLSESWHEIHVALKVVLVLILDGIIITTVILVTFVLNYIAAYLGLGNDGIVKPLIDIQGSIYIVLYLVFAIISLLSISLKELKTMIYK